MGWGYDGEVLPWEEGEQYCKNLRQVQVLESLAFRPSLPQLYALGV